jgi:DnaD/phage-associated family protein
MCPFYGFTRGTKSLPVPSPLLGSLLAEIDDLTELKCTLRFLWHSAQVPGSPKWVHEATLLTDAVLAQALGDRDAIQAGLDAAVARGTLVRGGGRYLLHTPENERAAFKAVPTPPPRGVDEPIAPPIANVYTLYEANIGLLTPMVAEQLRDAEETYPLEWLEAAIRQAAERNVRSWRYVSVILERWANEGRGGGSHLGVRGERHPEALTAAEYIKRFGLPSKSGKDK